MMMLLLSVQSFGGGEGNANLVEVEITPEYAKKLLARMDFARGLDAIDSEFSSLAFYDSTPDWLHVDVFDVAGEARSLGEGIAGVLDGESGSTWVRAPDDWAHYQDGMRTEIDEVYVTEDHVWWACVEKHSDIEYQTGWISRDVLEAIRDEKPLPAAHDAVEEV